MLGLNLITEEDWVSGRLNEPAKLLNLYKLRNFHKSLESLKTEYSGIIEYHKFNKRPNKKLINTLEYTENSPIFESFKLSPFSYYLTDFPDDGLWRNCDIDSSIYNKLTNNNKYEQPKNVFNFNKPYILFALQSNSSLLPHSFIPDIFIKTVVWATLTKNYILFKVHPFTKNDSRLYKYWSYLDQLGYISDYTVLVDKSYNLNSLITQARQVWTFSSGAGMQAVIAGKPVAHFYKNVDFMPMSTFSNTPEEAVACITHSDNDMARFLTWYYTKLTINSESTDLELRLRYRLEQYFVNKHTDISKIL